MRAYVIRRLLVLLPTLLMVSAAVFFMIDFIPYNFANAEQATSGGIEIDVAMIEHTLGLDAPVFVRYGRWLGVVPQRGGNFSGLLQGDFGVSWWLQKPLLEVAADRWPVTLELGLLGLVIAQLIALPIGIYSAVRQDQWGDYIGRTFAILCISVPGFWLATLIIVFPSIWWGYMPPIMLIHFTEDPIGNLKMFIMPAVVLGMGICGLTMRMTRTMMLEVLRQDYIRTAWAKGLRERVVVVRHALKNALIPVVTLVGLYIPVVIGGTVIIEQIFCLPGMGRLMLDAIMQRDQPLICGVVLLFAVFLVLVNLAVDLTYAYLDPRVRYR